MHPSLSSLTGKRRSYVVEHRITELTCSSLLSYTEKHSPALILDAGHIQLGSDLANQEMANEYKTKNYTKEDLEKLESLMYDKFNIQLSQTKLLIGPDIQDCLLQQQNPRKKNSANVIERIDIVFTAELCILQGITRFPKFKLSGEMPMLSLNVSDAKYKILMRMIDKILESIGSNDDVKSKDQSYATRHRQQNLLALELLGDTQLQQQPLLLSDTESEGEGAIIDTTHEMSRQPSRRGSQEEPLSKSFHSSSTASITTIQQEQFRFWFRVGKISASVHQTAKDNPMEEDLLCEIILDTFLLEFVSRPYDMAVDVCLKSLSIIDEMKHGHEFRYLVTSNRMNNSDSKETQKDLVRVIYQQVKREHPLFEQEYQGFNQSVDIALSTLNVIVTRSSILTLYNFILDTFTGPPQDERDEESDNEDEAREYADEGHTETAQSGDDSQEQQKANESGNSIKVKIHLDSVDLILNNDGTRLGTGVLSYGDLTVLVYPKTLKVTGRFGNFSLTDDTRLLGSAEGDSLHGTSDVYLLSIQGDELANFLYETFDEDDVDFPGYHQLFQLRMGAFRFNFLDTAKPTLNFLNEFLQMKTVYDAARMAAVERAQQLQESRTRFHFDVLIKSPIVEFPVGDNDRVLAYLGEIRAVNHFVRVPRRNQHNLAAEPKIVDMNKIECGLFAISMESTTITKQKERRLPIIDDLDISFDILSPESPADIPGPSLSMTGRISDVRMVLTEAQYAHLLLIYSKVMDFIFSGPEEDENNENIEEQTSAIETSSRLSSHTNHTNQKKKNRGPKKKQQQRQQEISKQAAIQMTLDMRVETVCLEILTGTELDLEERHKQRLALLAFNGTSMKFQSMDDASMLLELQMESIAFTDTRPKTNSKFKEIMSPAHLGSPQLQIQLKMPSKDEDPKIMYVLVAIDSPRVILSLDYVFLLRDFFMKPFAPEQATDAQTFAEAQREQRQLDQDRSSTRRQSNATQSKSVIAAQRSQKRSQQQRSKEDEDQTLQLQYRVSIVDVQLVCLARPESTASEAVIFSIKDIEVIQRKQLSCQVNGINMRLCRMDIGNESSWSFIQEFDVAFSMETSSSIPGHNITVMEMDIQPLVVHLSYHDAMIVIAIVNKALELMGNASQDTEEQNHLEDPETNALSYPGQGEDDGVPAIEPRSQEYVEPYIVMSKESASTSGILFAVSSNKLMS